MQDPSRMVPAIQGEIFEYLGNVGDDCKIGEIFAFLVLRGRAIDENKSLHDAMDSVDRELSECYAALFEMHTEEWSEQVEQAYENEVPGLDVLFIEGIELNFSHRGKGIAAQVVRETIRIFGSSCGLVACRPLHIQYEDEAVKDPQEIIGRECPGFEAGSAVDLNKFAKFWESLGFRKLPDSDFYTFAPQLVRQPDSTSPEFSKRPPEHKGNWVQ